ncbi:MAG TPA: RNA methyltransferase [Oligoflexus sp.]|uniref:TrmH family RNA methyltransferase n=1 Tax=Oligoflexus sp. TaxID=1971216 RepID=UPI002D7E4AAD|nr:RNA methyltransferase [Oligoflexus sp.]HET9236034.1 RNA methyltransferase [Oligoflexus sp.]
MSVWRNNFDEAHYPSDAWELLSPRLSPVRRERMQQVASQRTRHLRLVLQDVFDPHNVGACLRSAEAFGVLCCDQVNLYQKFGKISTVSRGADQWLEVRRFTDLDLYIQGLRAKGFKIAAAYPPGGTTMPLQALPLDAPLAVVFGNEREGLHKAWQDQVDYRFTIPMYGMVESFNISVSAALSLHTLTERCRVELPAEKYLLDAAAQKRLLDQWICRHSHNPDDELTRLRDQSSG